MEKYLLLIKKCIDYITKSDFPLDEVKKIAQNGFVKLYSPNEYFLQIGEKSRKVGFIVDGLFRIFYIDSEGNDYTKNFMSAGEITCSLAALLLNEPSKLNIQALEQSEVVIIDYDIILKLAGKSFEWQSLLRIITENAYLQKENRESDLLFYDVTERYLNFIKEHPDWEKRIQQRFIASYLGMTPETLSRIRSKPMPKSGIHTQN
jgi:CRP-like cAMP-binding protein